ncbi:MAG: ABC transporter permease [Clostridia bacterium]|nr:ABC transporter permease [Clostridia bacterium]
MTTKIIRLSLKAIYNNKLRSFLTMLGIIIGVMAVVILVSITQGATRGITSSIENMGSDRITATISDEDVTVTPENVEALTQYSSISSVAPTISLSKTVKKGSNTGNYSVVGVTSSYFDVMDEDIQRGRLICDSDNEWHTGVCVIGTEVATKLFGTWDAVGGTINIGDRVYKVVGVLEEQGSSLVGSDDSKVLIPYTTAARATGSSGVSSFYVKASSSDSVETAVNVTESYLLAATRDEDAFSVNNQSDILDTMDDVTNTLSLLLAGIAAISLIVGGIGIMNIMLVSVTERTREIGIRKAVGAKRRHILLQFLCESCVLSVLGGLIGLLMSLVGIYIYNIAASGSVNMNWTIALAAIAFCAVIGVLFGSYPAAKASKLQPIEALRAE